MSIVSMKCQMCLAEIPAESGKCPYCGADYRVKISGYCANCHAVTEANSDGACQKCGGMVIDTQLESHLIGQAGAGLTLQPEQGSAQQEKFSLPGVPPANVQPGRYLASLLRPGEKVLYRTRLHGAMLFGALFSLLLGLAVYFYFDWVGDSPASIANDPLVREGTVREAYAAGYWTIMFIAFLLGISAIRVALTWLRSEVLITSRRVLGRYSGFVSRLIEVELADIVRVNSSRAMIVDQGAVTILSAPRKTVILPNLPHPHKFRSIVEGLLPSDRPQLAKANWGRAILAVIGLLVIIAGVVVLTGVLAPRLQGNRQPASVIPSIAPIVNSPTPAIPTPTLRPVVAIEPFPDNGACMGSYRGGIVCIGPEGWMFLEGGLTVFSSPTEMTTCPDGRVLVLAGGDVYAYQDYEWLNYRSGDYYSAEDLACSPDGQVWVFHGDEASSYFNGGWTDFLQEDILGTDGSAQSPVGIAASPDGSIWLAYSSQLAHYDGSRWQVFASGQELSGEYTFQDIAVDSQGRPWALYDNGVLFRDGDSWKEIALPGSSSALTITIDANDQVWVGTYRNLQMYANGNWKTYDVKRGNKSGEQVRKIAVDNRGRVWIGTDWGLNVLDGNTWTTYHMHSSSLEDNHVSQIVVWDDGPELPALADNPKGSLEGKLTVKGQPVKDLRVEVCMASMGLMFSGSTPCSGEPFQFITVTDAEGRFHFDELPIGYYSVTFRTPGGKWKILSSTLNIGGKMVRVESGRMYTVETLDIEE